MSGPGDRRAPRLVAARGVWGNTRALSLLDGASATVEDSVLTAAVTPNNTTRAAALTDTTQLNGDTGGSCNQSGSAWSGNLFARCPLVDPAAGDFRLNDKVVNPCIDGGVAASAAGNAPPVDFDQRPRPVVDTRPDIGAYEVK